MPKAFQTQQTLWSLFKDPIGFGRKNNMSISIKIHDTDLTAQTCVVTIKDNDAIVLDKINIGLELNPNGTANTDNIIYRAKLQVALSRYSNTANSVTVTGHPSPISYTGE